MKKLFVLMVAVIGMNAASFAQATCESLVKECEKILKGKKGDFVSDGQVYTALLDRQKAEFTTTFYGGTTYRIACTAGTDDAYVIFTVRDVDGNVLFTNRKYKNSAYWDFKVPTTIPVRIETELDLDKKVTGCAIMMIGFKR